MTVERFRRRGAVFVGDNPLLTRMTLALLALAGLTTLTPAFAPAPVFREPPKPKVPELFAALQGTWEIEQNVNVNVARARGLVAIRRVQQRIRIQGTSWGYVFNNNGTEIESTKYEMVLDPKASPATLDLKQSNQAIMLGGGFGNQIVVDQVVMKGIVRVDGDTLTFSYVSGYQQNAERPKQFVAGNQVMPNGVMAMTMTLKRVK
jgi:uncharacterized protein (TIGR03067 family)